MMAELELKKQKYEIQATQQRVAKKQQQESMKLIRHPLTLQPQQMLMFIATLMENIQYQGA